MPRLNAKDSKNSKYKEHGRRLYKIWLGMKARCFNRNNIAYSRYGGKGIIVCNEWSNDFSLFYDWSIYNGYNEKLTIDRIDNNKNYEPSNCRWATRVQQSRNKSDNVYIEINGVTKLAVEWEMEYNLNSRLIYSRLHRGFTGEELLKDTNRNRNTKLSKEEVIKIAEIIKEGNLKNKQIAEIYDVSESTIKRIKNGTCWSDITGIKRG